MAAMSGEFSMFEHRSVGVLYLIAGFFGIIGNLVIVLIFWKEKPLAGSRNKMHIHLAIANMMVVAGTPFSGTSALTGRWLYGDTGCHVYGFETYTGGMGAVSFACFVCIQRALATNCSASYNTGSLSSVLSYVGWLFSLMIAVGPLIGWNSYVVESSGTACGLKWRDINANDRSFFLVLVTTMTVFIIAALLALNAAFRTHGNKTAESDWFSDNHLNWIAVSNLAIVCLGYAPYGFFAVMALFDNTSNMTMLASVIPPVVAKLSTGFYPLPYLLASKKFCNAFATRTIGGSTETKDE